MIDKTELIKEITEKEVLLEKLKKRSTQLPPGSIWVRTIGEKRYYRIAARDLQNKRHEHYIPASESRTLTRYSEAMYYRKLIPALESEIKAMRSFAKKYDPERKIAAWKAVPAGCEELIKNIFPTDEEICIAWENEPFPASDYPSDNGDRYMTKKNEAVRSRIEHITANTLYDMGLHYRYECRLDLNNSYIYPDFTVMHPATHELYYIEIFGMMDLPDYAAHAFQKIQKFADAGLASKLIPIFDSSSAPTSVNLMKKIFAEYFFS